MGSAEAGGTIPGATGAGRYTIAAVIPAHNRAGVITRALDSVRGQTRPPDEIVVVDDGSTDETVAVVEAYDSGVRLIRQYQRGVSAARNAGVEAATTDFVAFLDSDDYWMPDHLERMEGAIEATGGRAVLYFSDMRIDPAYGGSLSWTHCGFGIEGAFELRETNKDWLFAPRQPMMIQASVVKRDVYRDVGGSDLRFVRRGDTHLLFKLGLSGPLCAVAGVAGERTADAASSLTQSYSSEHPTYLTCTTELYVDLLNATSRLSKPQRTVLARRAAAAHFALARQCGTADPRATLTHLYRAVQLDRWVLLTRVADRIGRLAGGDVRVADIEERGGERRTA